MNSNSVLAMSDDNDSFIPAVIALLVAVAVSRMIGERGFQVLSNEQKLRLMDGFSRARFWSMIPLLILMALFWLLFTRTTIDRAYIAIGYFAMLAVYLAARMTMNQAKLVELEMPQSYRRTFALSQAISLLGLAWFFYVVFTTI